MFSERTSVGLDVHARSVVAAAIDTMLARWNKAPGPVVATAHQGNQRLHQRCLDFDARHKRPVIANTAIARELAGWCWTLATM